MRYARRMLAVAAVALAFAADGARADGLPERSAVAARPVQPFANFQVKVGASGVFWQDDNHGVNSTALGHVDGADAHVDDVWLPTAALTYYFSPNVAVELFCCAAHANVYGDGALRTLGQDKVADTWTFPPALTLQYHFDGFGRVRPYVGAGVQWIHYFNSDSDLRGALADYDDVKFRDSWGPVVQAGLDYELGGGWSLGLDVKYTWADTKITWRNDAGERITTKHDLDPLIVSANIGYKFNLDALFGR